MKQVKQELDLCFNEYETLQAQHIHVMQNESMPDLVTMTQTRDAAFNRLKKKLNDFVANKDAMEDNLSVMAEYETRLSALMAVSQELSALIEDYRGQLMTSLKKMQKGKVAMQGYKAANMNY